MTTDLACLVASALWGLGLTFFEVGAKTRVAGVAWNKGNRDTQPKVPAWVDRAGRALANHKENFPLFLTAVVVAHLLGKNDGVVAIACIAFVVARALHAVVYIAGIEGVRSLFFVAGLGAVLTIFARCFL